MPNPPKQPPTLSLAERDRRWANVRKLMRERGFDGLLVAGFRAREMYETYISDDYNEGCVIFPLEGDPVVITWAYLRVMRARWQDISEEFSHLMLVKSDEELAQVRYAARAAEAACKVIAEVAAPGVGEEVVFASATAEMLRHGIGVRYPVIVMNSGPHTLSWGPPRWTTSGEAPRILQRGDLVQAELMPLCGNQEVQVQMTVALDPLDDTNKKCEQVALKSYAAAMKALKPGITFADLLAAMEEPLKSAGCWGYTPLVHSVGPHFLAGRTLVNQDQVNLDVRYAGANAARQRQAILQPGMVFAFEPNACIGTHRVNIGGTVIVTATGCEELNHIPTTVTHKQ